MDLTNALKTELKRLKIADNKIEDFLAHGCQESDDPELWSDVDEVYEIYVLVQDRIYLITQLLNQ